VKRREQNPMNPNAAEFALFSLVSSLGVILAIGMYGLLRWRAKGRFGGRVVRDETTSPGPYRQGWFERVVALDASLALRLVAALSLSVALADSLARVALWATRFVVIEQHVRDAFQSETARPAQGSTFALFSWWSQQFPSGSRALLWWSLVVFSPLVANAASAWVASALLRARTIGARAGHATLAVSLVTRIVELGSAAVFTRSTEGLPLDATAPNAGAIIALPVIAFSSFALWRASRWSSVEARTEAAAQ
jgi:hypothetical protein